ncbi:pirin family protein [Pedobacter psychrodurus]|uniref:Pirin family protein n=1 Tax=Pedobacter psychrodurus TaxID=2530456 RepID=A0A4R0PZN4_9SPHI|nr:pirin family protein [Pedobacter psychrodurus]TCD28730.1 pirin family protein [Pedobacter psychrodurus]
MKKELSISTRGIKAYVGPLSITKLLPNRYAHKIGPFVFLDYISPAIKETFSKKGMGAHPHRGIATLSYILRGEVQHLDSAGYAATIHSGGVHWMKAGNGVIHDEIINYDTHTTSKLIEGFQFWINLPAKNKAEVPAHIALRAEEIPQKCLENGSGWIKVIVGNYKELRSQIPNYSEQFLYHIHLEAAKQFTIDLKNKIQVAAFLPSQCALLNDCEFQAGEFIEFGKKAGQIEIKNRSEKSLEIILFGGEEYKEQIVADGPFVMNTAKEVADAYKDFYAGKYGQIMHKQNQVETDNFYQWRLY